MLKRELLVLYFFVVTGVLMIDLALLVYFQTDRLVTGYLVYPYRDGQFIFLVLGLALLSAGAIYIWTRKESKT